MKIDKKTIESLLCLPDEKLIMMIRAISGGEFPKNSDPGTVAGLRSVLSRVTDEDIERAMQFISYYKKAKKQ